MVAVAGGANAMHLKAWGIKTRLVTASLLVVLLGAGIGLWNLFSEETL